MLKFKYIAIDFDNTITEGFGFPPKKIREHASNVINKIYNSGGIITIWTCRGASQEKEVKEFLNLHNIPYHYFNEPSKESEELFGVADSPKIWAEKYIDDSSLHCKEIDWLEIEKLLFEED